MAAGCMKIQAFQLLIKITFLLSRLKEPTEPIRASSTSIPSQVSETDIGAIRLTPSAYAPANNKAGDTQPVLVSPRPTHKRANQGGNIPTQPNQTSAEKRADRNVSLSLGSQLYFQS